MRDKPTVFIVDDDQDARSSLIQLVESMGSAGTLNRASSRPRLVVFEIQRFHDFQL